MTKFFDCFNDLNYILLKIVIKTSLKTLLYYHFVIFQEARDELETQKDELRDLMTKLEADRDMELEERQKLEEEIRAKQEEIERVKTTVDEKDEETKKLQEEMADARRQLEVK